jgi:hypothetical protein
VVVAAVGAVAVMFPELDPVALETIDGADMDAIGADDFHAFLDVVSHR